MTVRRNVTFLVVTLVLVFGTFLATLGGGHAPVLGLDLQGGTSVVLSPVGKFKPDTLDVAIDIIRNRVDTFGTLEPEITRQGSDIVIDLPGVKDRDKADRARRQDRRAAVPAGARPVAVGSGAGQGGDHHDHDRAGRDHHDHRAAARRGRGAGGDRVVRRRHRRDPHRASPPRLGPTTSATRAWCCPTSPAGADAPRYYLGKTGLTGKGTRQHGQGGVRVRRGLDASKMDLTDSGQQQVGRAGAAAVPEAGRDRARRHGAVGADTSSRGNATFASFGGTAVISGNFTQDEADNLAKLIKFGALPVVLRQVNVENVSPTLGNDQLHAGILAGIIGLALVALYMLVFYRLLGLVVIAGILLSGMALYSLDRVDPARSARHHHRAQPGRRHRHHRVGRRDRRLVHRLLRTA